MYLRFYEASLIVGQVKSQSIHLLRQMFLAVMGLAASQPLVRPSESESKFQSLSVIGETALLKKNTTQLDTFLGRTKKSV
jgi:hypothetical protein